MKCKSCGIELNEFEEEYCIACETIMEIEGEDWVNENKRNRNSN